LETMLLNVAPGYTRTLWTITFTWNHHWFALPLLGIMKTSPWWTMIRRVIMK